MERGMNTYDCFYLEDDVRQSHVTLVAADDAEAFVRAEELLAESRFICMEVRERDRLVGRVTIASPAQFQTGEGSGHTPTPK
jgi:hypothetical protein